MSSARLQTRNQQAASAFVTSFVYMLDGDETERRVVGKPIDMSTWERQHGRSWIKASVGEGGGLLQTFDMMGWIAWRNEVRKGSSVEFDAFLASLAWIIPAEAYDELPAGGTAANAEANSEGTGRPLDETASTG